MDIWWIVVLGYTIWAIYSGWKFMSGRVAFLEENRVISKILKFVCAVLVGYVVGVLQLLAMFFRLLTVFWR